MSNKHTLEHRKCVECYGQDAATWPSPSSENRQIAKSLGVSYPSVAKVRKSLLPR